ncbi:MAG: CapA family protein [Leptolyngbya sp. SIOISBB]|nr:CapA family protein [Leptolyngbya sp. SIOISBB]
MILVGDYVLGNLDIKTLFKKSPEEFILMNLEGPLLQEKFIYSPIQKAGAHLYSTKVPVELQPIILALANNHLMDFGIEGLKSTYSYAKKHNILFVGAGENLRRARQPIIVYEKNATIAILSCCEAQFGTAVNQYIGVAEFGPWLYAEIMRLRNDVDAVIVSSHAAVEDAPWPSPRIQEFYRSLIDVGAKVVHGHHAHVPQGVEEYKNGLILYGLGNFIVDPEKWQELPNSLWSIGIRVDFAQKPIAWENLTFEIEKDDENNIFLRESHESERIHHQKYIDTYNSALSTRDLLDALWQEVAVRSFYGYKAKYMNFPTDRIASIGFRERLKYARDGFLKLIAATVGSDRLAKIPHKDYLLWYVMFACESHRDSIATALGILSGELPDLRNKKSKALVDEIMPWTVKI